MGGAIAIVGGLKGVELDAERSLPDCLGGMTSDGVFAFDGALTGRGNWDCGAMADIAGGIIDGVGACKALEASLDELPGIDCRTGMDGGDVVAFSAGICEALPIPSVAV